MYRWVLKGTEKQLCEVKKKKWLQRELEGENEGIHDFFFILGEAKV